MADTLQIGTEVTPENPEYIAKMAAMGEAAVNGGVAPVAEEAPPEVPAKPEGIPDKFYNAETGVVDYTALAKSYTELEKANSTKKEPEVTPKDKPEDAPKDAAQEAVEAAGLDMPSLSKEYDESGTLSDDSYAKLEKAGIPRAMVDDYIAGQQAKVEVARTQAFGITDGEDGYKAMIDYAKANLSEADIAAYNKAVNSGDATSREEAVRGLWTKYSAESGNGTNGTDLITPNSNTKVGNGAYQSRAEMMADMGNPLYKSDEAFRAKVQAKLAVSNIF